MARNYYRHGMNFGTPEVNWDGTPRRAGSEFPLYSYVLACLYKLFGLHEILGRLLSMILTASSAVWLFDLVRRRLGEPTALASAFVLCVIPIHIYFTRTVQPEPMALWALLGYILFFDRWNQNRSNWNWGAALVLAPIAPLLKLPFLYLGVGLWVIMTVENKANRRAWRSWIFLPVLILPTLAWYHYTKFAPTMVLPLSAADQRANLIPILTCHLWRAQLISRFPELCSTYSGLLLGGVGAYAMRRERRIEWQFWGLWFLLLLVYTGLLGDYGLIHRYTLLPWAPVTAVFIGHGIVTLWRRHAKSTGQRVLVAILVLGIPLHAALRIKHWYRVERTYLFRAQPLVNKWSGPNDLVLTNTLEVPVLLYYIDRNGYAVDLVAASAADIQNRLTPAVRLFLTPTEGSWSEHPEWARFFAEHGQLISDDPEYCLYRLNAHVS